MVLQGNKERVVQQGCLEQGVECSNKEKMTCSFELLMCSFKLVSEPIGNCVMHFTYSTIMRFLLQIYFTI